MTKRHNYTMIELVAVLVIMGLISTVVISQFRKLPVFISLESKVNILIKVLAQARSSATCRGVNTEVVFAAENRRIYMPRANTDEQKLSPVEMYLPDEIKLSRNDGEVEDESGKVTLFKFYPDGTGGGNNICLELKKHKIQISISPLSGSISSEEINAGK